MSIFPYVDGDDGIYEDLYLEDTVYEECAWDFLADRAITEDGNPKILYKNEAIQVWIYKALKTPRYEHSIYTWDYGSEVDRLIGQGYREGYVKAEVRRYIEEALLINPYIKDVENVTVAFKEGVLSVTFIAKTVYGEVKIHV